ncbi:hypothetical protein ABZZ36_42230 [Actinacidiphila glaucinigra]|uniref:hypothetical protein n=1 Tax=Actinacidiphila glaucinigra TaxID=235986 RepID=UPI0033AEC5C5
MFSPSRRKTSPHHGLQGQESQRQPDDAPGVEEDQAIECNVVDHGGQQGQQHLEEQQLQQAAASVVLVEERHRPGAPSRA